MSLFETAAFTAFLMGIISASSLPLGALTTAIWRPGDRVIAFLLAFGGGALLAALTIDLVGSALDQGHFYNLAIGCIAGGLLFEVLNQLVNRHGGFLRKASTTIYHLRTRRERHVPRILPHLGRIQLFRDLPQQELERLAAIARLERWPAGAPLYHYKDPSDRFYVIEEGQVELLDPKRGMRPFQRLRPHDAFARMAFFTNAPHATVGRGFDEVRLWVFPRGDFNGLLRELPVLQTRLAELIDGEEVATYLAERHGLSGTEIDDWREEAIAAVLFGDPIPPAVESDRRMDEFEEVCGRIARLPLFRGISPEEVREVGARVFHRRHRAGHRLFHQGEPADRIYIIERGEVALIDPATPDENTATLGALDAFGGNACLAGTRHSYTAVTAAASDLWVLRRRDFDELLGRCPALRQRVETLLRGSGFLEYLTGRGGMSGMRARQWVERAAQRLAAARTLPPVHNGQPHHDHSGAPMAIWLGILLDGIPESLVIGASLIHHQISFSLIAGLFLSNYPEALSSSAGMREQGMSFRRVLWMWTSLMVITGIGAALGNLFFVGVSPASVALVQGVAAGAMLTMIAETMLPEAYIKGGSIIGLSTLAGFLAAIFFKTLE